MEFSIPFEYIATGLVILACYISYVLGAMNNKDAIIENTIDFLIQNGFVKSKTNSDGEIELIKLDED